MIARPDAPPPVAPALTWNEFQHQNKGKWTTAGLKEAYHRYKETIAVPNPTASTQVKTNYRVGTQFDQHVQQTILHGFSQGKQTSGSHAGKSVLGVQESFNVFGVPDRTSVRPDYSFYDRTGQLMAIGDAKATSYLTNTPQMQGLIQIASKTPSQQLVIYTPQGSGLTLSLPLRTNAISQGVNIRILEVP